MLHKNVVETKLKRRHKPKPARPIHQKIMLIRLGSGTAAIHSMTQNSSMIIYSRTLQTINAAWMLPIRG